MSAIPTYAVPSILEFLQERKAAGDDKAEAILSRLPKKGKRKELDPKIREVPAKKTKAIREACVEREGGVCAVPGCRESMLHMDHFWGRGKVPEAVENCWMLCIDHDRQKTHWRPSRLDWIFAFRIHAQKHGYAEQMEKCDRAAALEQGQHPVRLAVRSDKP